MSFKNVLAMRTYVILWLMWQTRNRIFGINAVNLYIYNDVKYSLVFDNRQFLHPLIYISYQDDTTGQTSIRIRILDNRYGFLEKINVNENLRGKRIATTLVDFVMKDVAPHIHDWKIVGIVPTNEAEKFWSSIIERYPDKMIVAR